MLSTIMMSMGQFTTITQDSKTALISTTDVDDSMVYHTCDLQTVQDQEAIFLPKTSPPVSPNLCD